jgi:hypothetical protein
VVLETVLVDGLADLTADLAADGTTTQATHGGSGDGTEDDSGGSDERAIGGAELGGAQGCCGAAGGSCDSADGGACGATTVEGLDAGGLALGATEHGEISLGCVMWRTGEGRNGWTKKKPRVVNTRGLG